MTTAAIRRRLSDYIEVAEDKKVKAMYSMLEDQIDAELDLWANEESLLELDKRTKDYESGNVKGMPWDAVKQQIKTRNKPDAL